MRKYKVGYKKPPKHTQFKPGESGNKKGRRIKPFEHFKMFERIERELVAVKVNGRIEKMSTREVIMRALAKKAMAGDAALIRLYLKYSPLHNQDIVKKHPEIEQFLQISEMTDEELELYTIELQEQINKLNQDRLD